MYALRGEAYLQMENWDRAIVDLEEAAFTQLTRVDSKGSYIRGEPIFPDRSARSTRVVAGG